MYGFSVANTKGKLSPRSCIGRTFAMTEIKVSGYNIIQLELMQIRMQCLVVVLLQRFSFRSRHKIEPFQSFVIRPRVAGQTSSSLPLQVKKL